MKMKVTLLLVAVVVLVVAVLGSAVSAVDNAPQKHEFQTPKATVVVTVHHGKGAGAGAGAGEGEAEAEAEAAPAAGAAEGEGAAAAAAEEEQEEGESTAAEESEVAKEEDLSHFTLPPEPSAAKGYRSTSCPGDDPCSEKEDEADEEQEQEGCTENCAAETDSSNAAAGKVVFSQPLGDADRDGFAAARNTGSSSSSSGNSWTVVPQGGLDTTSSLPSNVGMPPAGSAYVSPEDRRIQRLQALEAQEEQQRDAEKNNLHNSLASHQSNLAKIDAMSRALRFQYTELRREHNLLRSHIAANKAMYEELGGENEYKGTDLDIEGPSPAIGETLDEIPAIAPQATELGKKTVYRAVERAHANQKAILDAMHRSQNAGGRAMFGEEVFPKDAPTPSSSPSKTTKNAGDSISKAEAAVEAAEQAK